MVVAGLAPTPPGGQPGATGAKTGNHKLRTGVLIGGAAAILLAAGVGIGHAAWGGNGLQPLGLLVGQLVPDPHPLEHRLGQRSGSGSSNSGNPFGNSPFSGGSSGDSGEHRARATRARRTRRDRAT